jgi:hypothetical protein
MSKGSVDTLVAKRWVSKVVGQGCIVCRNLGYGATPAVYHHIRIGAGAGQKNGPFLGIALCPQHHVGEAGVGFHTEPRTFERIYGSELDLLNQTIGELA